MARRIGDDLREATDWLQDTLLTTRPQADVAMVHLLREGLAQTTDAGIMLTEDEEEVERHVRKATSNSKLGFRNHKRSKSRVAKKNLGPDISSAEQMILKQQARAQDEE